MIRLNENALKNATSWGMALGRRTSDAKDGAKRTCCFNAKRR